MHDTQYLPDKVFKMTKMTINHYIYLCYNSIYFFDLIVGKIKNIVVNKLQ